MERLTKKELRALLEFIKVFYPNGDFKTFSQRVFSRLSKIVHTEICDLTVDLPQPTDASATYRASAKMPSLEVTRKVL